jgi:isoamylase
VDDFLSQRGLTNYWGYNSIGFFAPESSYRSNPAPGSQVAEFKTLVRELHRAGIMVFLDVVYNHAGEGSELGPTIFLRGIDNPSYYSLTGPPDAPLRYYQNFSGCGNSLDFESAPVIRLVMDSLRYWMEVMHVDGFRSTSLPFSGAMSKAPSGRPDRSSTQSLRTRCLRDRF